MICVNTERSLVDSRIRLIERRKFPWINGWTFMPSSDWFCFFPCSERLLSKLFKQVVDQGEVIIVWVKRSLVEFAPSSGENSRELSLVFWTFIPAIDWFTSFLAVCVCHFDRVLNKQDKGEFEWSVVRNKVACTLSEVSDVHICLIERWKFPRIALPFEPLFLQSIDSLLSLQLAFVIFWLIPNEQVVRLRWVWIITDQ